MTERGIKNTKADIWAHLFPQEAQLYWYYVRHMRDHIADAKPPLTPGKSKDGSVTGWGYLIKISQPFITACPIPKEMVDAFDWENGTDRQVGLIWGERILDWCVTLGKFRLSCWNVKALRCRSEQNDIGDFAAEFVARPLIELKTELKAGTGNLYVQTAEKNHQVNLTRSGTLRNTPAPSLIEGI